MKKFISKEINGIRLNVISMLSNDAWNSSFEYHYFLIVFLPYLIAYHIYFIIQIYKNYNYGIVASYRTNYIEILEIH